MRTNTIQVDQPTEPTTWFAANAVYLEGQWQRLRLLLERRILWLRRQWRGDDSSAAIAGGADAVIRDAAADQLLASEDASVVQAFFETDRRAREIGEELRRLEGELEACSRRLAAEGQSAALDVLCRLFGLNTFERDVLLLAAAPEFDPSFARLYAYVQDDANLRQATPQLALALFCRGDADRLAAEPSLLPEAVLRQRRLVELDSESTTCFLLRALRMDERVRNYLGGVNHLDSRVRGVVRPVAPLPLPKSQAELAKRVAVRLRDTDGAPRWRGVVFHGSTGSGREAVACGVAQWLQLHLHRVDVERLPAGAEMPGFLALLGREAMLSQLGLYFDVAEGDPAQTGGAEIVQEAIERLPVFCLVTSRSRLDVERPLLTVAVPALDAEERRVIWQQALASAGSPSNGQVDAVAEQFDFEPQRIVRAVQTAVQQARWRNSGRDVVPTAEDLWEACRAQTCWRLSELAQPLEPAYTWDDIVLPEDVGQQLHEIAAQVSYRGRVYREWGFGAQLVRGSGLSALFSGVSGTGKTMAAEVLAKHLRLDLYRVDLAGVVNKYIGETEKNLRVIFSDAERYGAILFFDEADALFGRRTEIKDSHDRFANIEVNYLLQRMEEYRGLSILATNRKADLDRAFLRRLRFLVDFPFPGADQRRRIWQKVFPPRTPLGDLDYERLARMEITGGSIRNIALAAAFLAAQAGTPVEMTHLLRAARREYAKTDKLMDEVESLRGTKSPRRG